MSRKAVSVEHGGPDDVPASKGKGTAEQWPRKIRTVHRPWKDVEVSEAEYNDLATRNLIHKGE